LRKVKPETTNKKFKLIIVGHSNVGKSTIINHFCSGVKQDTISTTGIVVLLAPLGTSIVLLLKLNQ